MLETVLAVFLGLVLFALVGDKAIFGVRLAAMVSRRPIGRLLKWIAKPLAYAGAALGGIVGAMASGGEPIWSLGGLAAGGVLGLAAGLLSFAIGTLLAGPDKPAEQVQP